MRRAGRSAQGNRSAIRRRANVSTAHCHLLVPCAARRRPAGRRCSYRADVTATAPRPAPHTDLRHKPVTSLSEAGPNEWKNKILLISYSCQVAASQVPMHQRRRVTCQSAPRQCRHPGPSNVWHRLGDSTDYGTAYTVRTVLLSSPNERSRGC